jgi:hypothetical protein
LQNRFTAFSIRKTYLVHFNLVGTEFIGKVKTPNPFFQKVSLARGFSIRILRFG